MILRIIVLVLSLQIIDNLISMIYSRVAKRYYSVARDLYTGETKTSTGRTKASARILKTLYSYYGGWVRYKLRRLGNVPCHFYRNFKLKHIYHMEIGKKVVIYGGFEIRAPWNITIGEGSVIGDEAKLDGRNGISIGKNVNLSSGVWIWTEQHDTEDPYFAHNDKGGQVVVDDRVWLSTRTIVLPKIHIGEGSVIAAGAVVTKNCDPYTVYGGVPARKIGMRNTNLRYTFTGHHSPFF